VVPAAPDGHEGLALELPAWDPSLRPPTRQDYRPGPTGHLTSASLQQSSRRTGASLQKIVRRDIVPRCPGLLDSFPAPSLPWYASDRGFAVGAHQV